MENGMQMTLEGCMPEIFQKQIAGASDSHVRTSPLQENKPDFKETVQACFSELCTLSDSSKKKINPLIFSLRTLKICLVLMEDGISPDCSLKWSMGGYDVEWQVLNSKDFGVPQNRERCFIIGHLRERSTSKIFPIEGTENSVSLNLFGCLNGRNSQRDRVYSGDGLAPTISTKPGGNTEPKVAILFDTSYIGQDGTVYAVWYEKYQCYTAIRKLTPKECFRLQGWTDDYFEKAEFVNSDSQLYKQAGNGVTVSVIEAIAKKMEEKI